MDGVGPSLVVMRLLRLVRHTVPVLYSALHDEQHNRDDLHCPDACVLLLYCTIQHCRKREKRMIVYLYYLYLYMYHCTLKSATVRALLRLVPSRVPFAMSKLYCTVLYRGIRCSAARYCILRKITENTGQTDDARKRDGLKVKHYLQNFSHKV